MEFINSWLLQLSAMNLRMQYIWQLLELAFHFQISHSSDTLRFIFSLAHNYQNKALFSLNYGFDICFEALQVYDRSREKLKIIDRYQYIQIIPLFYFFFSNKNLLTSSTQILFCVAV